MKIRHSQKGLQKHVRSPMGSEASGMTMRDQNCDQNVSSSHHFFFFAVPKRVIYYLKGKLGYDPIRK